MARGGAPHVVAYFNAAHWSERLFPAPDGRFYYCGECTVGKMVNNFRGRESLKINQTSIDLIIDRMDATPFSVSSGSQIERGLAALGVPIIANVQGFDSIWPRLTVGRQAAVIGRLDVVPSTHPLRRYGSAGGHVVLMARLDNSDRVWADNPLAPAGAYQGEWITKSELASFVSNTAGDQAIITPLGAELQETTMKTITDLTPRLIDFAKDTPYYAEDGTTRIGTAGADITDRYSPFACGAQRAFYVGTPPSARLGLVTPSAIKPIPAPPAPPDMTPYSQADLDAAKAAALADGTAAGKAAEKSRLRTLLGI